MEIDDEVTKYEAATQQQQTRRQKMNVHNIDGHLAPIAAEASEKKQKKNGEEHKWNEMDILF